MVALAHKAAERGLDNGKQRLIGIISRVSLLRNVQMRLASGVSSSFYFDMKRTLFDPEGLWLVSGYALAAARQQGVRFVGGLELGAVPLIAGIVQASFQDGGQSISGFFVRKEPKQHGTRRIVEGLTDVSLVNGQPALVVDDVTTSGGSVMKAVQAARNAGALVTHVLTVVDRMEGATENLAKEGIVLISLTIVSDYRIQN
jgi:orotate phosphoribosyltransferase